MASANPPHLATFSTSNSASSSEQASNAQTLEEFYSGLGLSPPANANEILMSDIKNTANYHLPLVGKNWNALDECKQAKISFLV
jgi:hypothetical protein